MQEFLYLIQYLLAENFVDVQAGDFNYGHLKVTERKPLNILMGYYQIKNKRINLPDDLNIIETGNKYLD